MSIPTMCRGCFSVAIVDCALRKLKDRAKGPQEKGKVGKV